MKIFFILFNDLFEKKEDTYIYKSSSNNFRVKGYREDRLEEYLINGLRTNFDDIYEYQIENTVAFVHKILEYNFNLRLTAEQCKSELILIESQI